MYIAQGGIGMMENKEKRTRAGSTFFKKFCFKLSKTLINYCAKRLQASFGSLGAQSIYIYIFHA